MAQFMLLVITVAFSITSNAAGGESRLGKTRGQIEGLRVSLVKSFFTGIAKVNADGYTFEDTSNEINQEYGVGIGYALIRKNDVGILGEIIYSKFGEDTSSNRFEGGLTYGLTKKIYFLGGINVHEFSNQKQMALRRGSGLRIGGGMMFENNMGFTLSYVSMKHANTYTHSKEVRSELTLSGMEFALNGMF